MESVWVTRRGWAGLFLIGAGLNIVAGLHGWPAVLAGHLNDPDSYMRLERLSQGIAQGQLVNLVARDDSGAGVMVEWSCLLDVLLWLMAVPLSVFIGWRPALFAAGVALGPIGVGCLALALAFAVRPLVKGEYLWAAAGAAALLPGLQIFAAPGVVHYHILLLALIALTFGLVARSWQGDGGYAVLAGLAGGAAIWMTPETMPFVLMIYAALLFRWLERPITGAMLGCAAGFAGMVSFACAVDPPEGGSGVIETDRLSLVYVVLGMLLLAGALALWQMRGWRAGPRRICGTALMAGLMLGWIALFPKVAMGPYGLMDAAQRRMFFGAIMETQPARSPGDFIRFLLPGLVAMLYLGWRAAYGGRQTWLWGYATACAAVALLLGMKFVLFVEFSAGLAAGLLPVMLADISARLKAIPAAAAAARLALIFVFLLATRTPLLHKAKAEALPPSPSCDLLHIGPMLAPFAGKVVLADVSATPELLYRTGILTVGSLYQHGVPGFLRARAAWRSVPGAKAPPELAAAQARLILFCPAPGRYALVADLPPDTLWDALDHNRIPGWLKLRAEDGGSGWELFQLR